MQFAIKMQYRKMLRIAFLRLLFRIILWKLKFII